MNKKTNPISEPGERNVYCPHYNNCLDYAVSCSWQAWNCSRCPYKLIKQQIIEYELHNIETFYDLPLYVEGAVRVDEFD